MIRRVVKQVAACGMHWSGVDRWAPPTADASDSLVLCYHRVVEDVRRHPWCAPAMMVSLATFERQLDWLARRFELVDLDTLTRIERGELRLARPAATVTFDDGYEDVARLALPLLRRKGIAATVFVVTNRTGVEGLHRHDELYWLMTRWMEERGGAELARELRVLGVDPDLARRLERRKSTSRRPGDPAVVHVKERLLQTLPRRAVETLIEGLRVFGAPPQAVVDDLRTLDWPELIELRDGGTLIGSHTRSHCILPHETETSLAIELHESKRLLEQRLGVEIAHLSYPDGRFSRATLAAADAAGYRFAYTTCSHRSAEFPHLTMPRRTFWEGSTAGVLGSFSGSIAACAIRGVFDPFRSCGDEHGLTDAVPDIRPGERSRPHLRKAASPARARTGEEVAGV